MTLTVCGKLLITECLQRKEVKEYMDIYLSNSHLINSAKKNFDNMETLFGLCTSKTPFANSNYRGYCVMTTCAYVCERERKRKYLEKVKCLSAIGKAQVAIIISHIKCC
jgi:hypothetical protein